VEPVVTNEQTKAFLSRLPPTARAGFIGGALARAGYDGEGTTPQANLLNHEWMDAIAYFAVTWMHM
jgi:hypothetical protein